jgi:NAD(P)-dependent dehydrogenase (short-subunit alcohol dehydrogenase family)
MSDVVVITGASAGVGRAAARAFGARGDRVALIARGEAGLRAAAEEVRAAGGQALVLPCDVSDADAVEAAAARAEEQLGPIDVWVNNAMTAVLAEVADTPAEEFRRVTEVTYLGSVHGAQAALRRMLPRDRGVIVQVGSALAFRGIPLQATYCGAKHAIEGFCESLRTELMHRKSGVRLAVVHLPGMNTTQFSWVRARTERHPQPVPPIYQPEVAADVIVWAAHHRRKRIWVGYPTVQTIVGNRLAAWVADRYLARTGFDSQQTDQPMPPGRPDYLFSPLDAETDHGLHGEWGDQAVTRSTQVWLNLHRGTVAAAAAAVGVAGAVAGRMLRA